MLILGHKAVRHQMLPKEEAERIAEKLLDEERRTRPLAWARRVPWPPRTADSQRLDRELQWELLREARRNIFDSGRPRTAVIAAPVAILLSFFLFMRHPVSAWYVLVLDVALVVPLVLVSVQVRRELTRLARKHRNASS
jgi:hypothetical protein